VPAELVGRQDVGVAVIDLDRQHLGERGIELARLVVDRGLLVVLARRDLGEIEVGEQEGSAWDGHFGCTMWGDLRRRQIRRAREPDGSNHVRLLILQIIATLSSMIAPRGSDSTCRAGQPRLQTDRRSSCDRAYWLRPCC
jgi:hypothetical protein